MTIHPIPVYVYEVSGTNIRVAIGDKWAKYDAGSGTLVPVEAGTEGAVRIAVRADDGNNNFQVYRSNNQAVSLLDYTESISLRFRYLGERDLTRLISPTMHGSSVYGGGGIPLVTITASDKALRALDTPVAYLDTTRYYDIDFKLYTVEDGKEGNTQLYTLRFDLYLDGILVYTGAANSNYTKKPATGFTGNNTYRYTFICGFDGAISHSESDKDVIYVKSLKDVVTPSDACRLAPAVNSGNTVEGYDLTLGSNLELNYYMNLLPDVVADANAKVTFKIGEEVVAEKNVSEVTPGAKGLYKFTCPVNSTQMAADVKVSIESTTREYKIYMNGVASDEYTYKVVDYAKYILEGEFSAETKALVKAMLNYGAYAQTYFAEKNGAIAGTLANVGCEFDQAKLDTAVFGEGTATVTGGLTGIKATLVLDTDTKIKIYQGETLLGTSEGITADKLDDDVTITVEGGTVKVSVLTLAGKVPAEKPTFKNLAKALALYSQATEAYKAAQ